MSSRPSKLSPKLIKRSVPASFTKSLRTRCSRANSTQRWWPSSPKSRSSKPNAPAPPASRTPIFSFCWFFFTAWACCVPTAARARGASSNAFATSSRNPPNSSAKNPASLCRDFVAAASVPAYFLPACGFKRQLRHLLLSGRQPSVQAFHSAPPCASPCLYPNSTSSANNAPSLSPPPTAAKRNQTSAGYAPPAPKPSSDFLPARIRFSRTTVRTALPTAETSLAKRAGTASPTPTLGYTHPKSLPTCQHRLTIPLHHIYTHPSPVYL